MTAPRRPIALVIIDGWGIDEPGSDNAVSSASTPRLDDLFARYPSTRLGASGLDVGLPEGQMGNSEVGHLNIGAGRTVYQDLTRISKSIAEGDFYENPALLKAMATARKSGGKLHLMGLLSDGGVHSLDSHLYALVEMAKRQGLAEVCIHAFLDGRDTPPQSAAGYLARLEEKLEEIGLGKVATITGRFYAMDRDNRWDRVERAWRAIALGEGKQEISSAMAIESAYAAGQTDEFVEPRVIVADGTPIGAVHDWDALVFFNFRADRAREITRSFTEKGFDSFERGSAPSPAFVCMTEYDESFGLPVAFAAASHAKILGEVVSEAGLTQLRIAETEKYAHVTFFFNGGSEIPFTGEERVLIPSPKDIATYDQRPAMSSEAVTDELVDRIAAKSNDLIVLNYANPDMVGHTGITEAAIEAMETVDLCVGRIVDAVLEAGGSLLITSDHGNCEQMAAEDGGPFTAHTSNPVPLILVDPDRRDKGLKAGILADIAPTILELLGIEKPAEMTGSSLLQS